MVPFPLHFLNTQTLNRHESQSYYFFYPTCPLGLFSGTIFWLSRRQKVFKFKEPTNVLDFLPSQSNTIKVLYHLDETLEFYSWYAAPRKAKPNFSHFFFRNIKSQWVARWQINFLIKRHSTIEANRFLSIPALRTHLCGFSSALLVILFPFPWYSQSDAIEKWARVCEVHE